MKKRNLILVRHGQSEWNAKNLFTGWENPGLTETGKKEAQNAGDLINSLDIGFDCLFTSALIRAQLTGAIILKTMNQEGIKVVEDKALNERFYGDLQGMNKDECKQKWGEELVQSWRRSYELGPPGGETLKETGDRVLPYYLKEIHPMLIQDMNIIVAAHGNSLRSLIKYLDKVSDEDIVKLEIPTGEPIHYRFNGDGKVMYKKNLIE